MNNNDFNINLYNNKKYKNTDYASLKIGAEFYVRKPILNDSEKFNSAPYKKIVSEKINEHTWTNAKTKLGEQIFIPYDKKVYVEVKL